MIAAAPPVKRRTSSRFSRAEGQTRLAYNLRRVLAERGTTAHAFAREHKFSYRAIQRITLGETSPIGWFVFTLAQALDTTVEELFRPIKKIPR